MSHNKIKVADQNPDASGNITIELGNLSNVSTSGVSNNEVLKYNGSSWDTGVAPAGSPQYIRIGNGESDLYSNSTATGLSQNDSLQIYDTNPIENIAGATLTKTNNWIREITLPAGEYQVLMQVNVVFSASGYLLFNLAKTSDSQNVTNSGLIGDNASSYASGVASTLSSHMNLTSSETLKIKLAQSVNVDSISNQGNTISEHCTLFIMKV